MIGIIDTVRKIGAEIVDIIVLAEKKEYGGVQRVFKETGVSVTTLIKISIAGNTSKVLKN
jgi:adenine/guanine phosphoribosyltransferase-like PRPP-binding protein